MARVIFKPCEDRDGLPEYTGLDSGKEVIFKKEGDGQDVSPEMAERLIKTWPKCFALAGEGEGEKPNTAPPENANNGGESTPPEESNEGEKPKKKK